ncbi:hypothetical protein LCGC14_0973430 [marine sediment metagenome]|uniref:tRNA (guanine(26)-N(2))-dimethyltransferase n=1 Tax=marine sediment metagenome TaxID=412755 RepID=A0A0F9NAW1_9ZZZZ
MKNKEKIHFNVINEGSTEFYIHSIDKNSVPSKAMAVFYNQKMEINRDISNLAILAYNKLINQDSLVIVDLMAASGVSSIRMLNECKNIKKIYINDINPIAVEILHKNISLNDFDNHSDQIEISQKDANLLLTEITQRSYLQSINREQKPNIISIDPFGTPNIYLDSAFKAIQKINGLLCITATDTPVLFGIRPKTCLRKYMSKPLHTEYCKEIGARILIYFISRIANINKLGIVPLLTFYSSHFLRVFCITFKDRNKISKFFKNYGFIIHCNKCGYRSAFQNNILELLNKCPLCDNEKIDYAGPLWVGEIHEKKYIEEIISFNEKFQFNNQKKIKKKLLLAKEEIDMPISYYNIHKLCQELKISLVPKLETIIYAIREKGFKISRTNFDFLSFKTNLDIKCIKKTLLELEKKENMNYLGR